MAPTALITGVMGQDGSLLAELLLRRGYRVVGVTRHPGPGHASLPSGASLIDAVALTNPSQVRVMLERVQPDEIYHLAAQHHSADQGASGGAAAVKEAMVSTNFLSTEVLAFALMEMKSPAHFVFASSSQIHTAERACHDIDENSLRKPSTFYGHTKAWSMDLLQHLRSEHRLRASVAILFNHESPRRRPDFVSRKITQAAARAARGATPALILGNIGARVDWSSAEDAAEALALMGSSTTSEDYVIASGRLHSVRNWLEEAFGAVGLDWERFTTFKEDVEGYSLVGNPRAIDRALGWRCSTSFAAMVKGMVEHDLEQVEIGLDPAVQQRIKPDVS